MTYSTSQSATVTMTASDAGVVAHVFRRIRNDALYCVNTFCLLPSSTLTNQQREMPGFMELYGDLGLGHCKKTAVFSCLRFNWEFDAIYAEVLAPPPEDGGVSVA